MGGYQDSGHSIKRDPGANVSVANELPPTVGALHDRIYELYESRGWFVFQQLYHEAAGLRPRRKKADETNVITNGDAAAGPPALLDPVVLRTMAPRVAAFMLYEPPERPPWRRQETLAHREHRQTIEDCGSWVGE